MRTRVPSVLVLAAFLIFGSDAVWAGETSYEGKPASYWIHAIGTGDEQGRADAATALRFLGLSATGDEREQLRAAVPALLTAVKDPDETLRVRAALALGNIDPGAAKGPMLEALGDASLNMRVAAAYVLARAGRAAIPALVEALKSKDPRVRSGATDALRDMGGDAASAIPALKETLKDPEPAVKVGAALALQKIEGKLPGPEEYGHSDDTPP